jgi:hypothetical protein
MNSKNLQSSTGKTIKSEKVDSMTEIQDSIDSLSLSLFEALRGLRDAVAPESSRDFTEEAGDTNSNNDPSEATGRAPLQRSAIDYKDMDYDDFLMAYHNDEPYALELIRSADGKPPKTRAEYKKSRGMNEMKIAMNVTKTHAEKILSKSALVDTLVSELPGMHRTKGEQMQRIQELLKNNMKREQELISAYHEATTKRIEIRSELELVTCKALGILQEK